MKVTIWRGCSVVAEHDHPELPGPDISLDPFVQIIGAIKDSYHEAPVPYRNGITGTLSVCGRMDHVCAQTDQGPCNGIPRRVIVRKSPPSRWARAIAQLRAWWAL